MPSVEDVISLANESYEIGLRSIDAGDRGKALENMCVAYSCARFLGEYDTMYVPLNALRKKGFSENEIREGINEVFGKVLESFDEVDGILDEDEI